METKESKPSRNMTFRDDPYYFGHYANMARHNAFLILEYISEIISKENKVAENLLPTCSLITKSYKQPDELNKVVFKLLEHFPFLIFFHNRKINAENINDGKEVVKLPDVFEILKMYLQYLSDLRNEMSHYNHPHIKQQLTGFQDLFNDAINGAQKRMKTLQKNDFKPLITSPYFSNLQDKNDLTDNGRYFFLCLFLEKKYAFEFLAKIKGYKNTTKIVSGHNWRRLPNVAAACHTPN